MLRIAVLDDEKEYIEKIESITEKYMSEQESAYDLKSYTDPKEFLMDLEEKEYFDLYLLDVEVPPITGLEAARKIRKSFSEPFIIYITNYVEYAVEAYEVNAYRYIPKNILDDKLPKAYEALFRQMNKMEEESLVIINNSKKVRIPHREIYYLRKEGKYTIIVHTRGENKIRKTLNEVLEELPSKSFLVIDRSYVVNLKHVMGMNKDQVRLRDETLLPVSKPRLQKVKEAIVLYWG